MKRVFRRAAWWACVLGGLWAGGCAPPLTRMEPEQFEAAFAADVQRFRDYDRMLHHLTDAFESRRGLFDRRAADVPSADDEAFLRSTWTAIHETAFALDEIRAFYADWYRFGLAREKRTYRVRSYLLTFAADASLYETSRRLVRQLGRNANVVKFLDAPDPTGMLEAGSVTRFRRRLQNSADAARVRAGRRYLFVMDRLYDLDAKARAAGCPWLWERAQALAARPELSLSLESSTASVGSDLAVLKRGVKRTWFPLQKGVAAWMGEVRLRRPGRYLITPAQQREIAARLEPGDILLSRKNWYLSNVGLPGFWPHAILHVGTPDELTAWADDVEVRAYLRRLTGEETTLGACLARRYPRRWAAYLAGGSGGSIRVIEAIGEGVMLNPLAAASGDYLAVLRPRLPKVAKAQAIIAAFGYLGRPYDFDFDFATDNALVCTELVWRSYRPADGKEGLTIRPVKIAGRRTLPANELARLFADEHGRDDAQLQFVCFFDASEETQSVHVATEADFLDSWRRSKWDIRQP